MPAPNPRSARYICFRTAALSTAHDFFGSAECVFIGILGEGSTIPDTPTTSTYQSQAGKIGVNAAQDYVFRITEVLKGDLDALKAIRNEYGVVAAVVNKPATKYTEIGPGIMSSCDPIGANMENAPDGIKAMFSVDEDFSEEVVVNVDEVATVTAA
ncbi:MAG: hypothetical protein AAF845_05750 [Bacteroidota bacterium]